MTTRQRPTAEPSHAVIIERIEHLGELMRMQFEAGGRRFDRIEQRLKEIEDGQKEADAKRSEMAEALAELKGPADGAPWWRPYAVACGLVLLALFAGGGLTLVVLTQLDLLGPIMEAARQAHEMGNGQ